MLWARFTELTKMRKIIHRQMVGITASWTCKTNFRSWWQMKILWLLDGHWARAPFSLVWRKQKCVTESRVPLRSHTWLTLVVLWIWPLPSNLVLRMFLKHSFPKCRLVGSSHGFLSVCYEVLLFWGKVRKWVPMTINLSYSKYFSLFHGYSSAL